MFVWESTTVWPVAKGPKAATVVHAGAVLSSTVIVCVKVVLVFPQSYHPRTFVILCMFYVMPDQTSNQAVRRTFSKLVEVAAEHRPALILMGTHGRRGLAHALLGSVAENVIRACSVPVLTVRGQAA